MFKQYGPQKPDLYRRCAPYVGTLVDEIIKEIERVFPVGFNGDADEYAFLAQFGVEEYDDVQWGHVILGDDYGDDYDAAIYSQEAMEEFKQDDDEMRKFLADENGVREFLVSLLSRYKSAPVYSKPEKFKPFLGNRADDVKRFFDKEQDQ